MVGELVDSWNHVHLMQQTPYWEENGHSQRGIGYEDFDSNLIAVPNKGKNECPMTVVEVAETGRHCEKNFENFENFEKGKE